MYVDELPIKINLSDDFFDEEVRAGCTVSQQMKEVWAIELDLLSELLRVCGKYNIRISAVQGTLLGAVRHQGFIPWDDDIDMGMLREDYEKLCEVAPYEFKEPYFFQTEYTDHGSLRGHAQLRNSKTTAILVTEKKRYLQFNQGIFIDIFPYDYVINDKSKRIKEQKHIIRLKKLTYVIAYFTDQYYPVYRGIKGATFQILHIIFSFFFRSFNYDILFQKIEVCCKKHQDEKLSHVSFVEQLQKWDCAGRRPKSFFTDLTRIQFEFMQIPVARQYIKLVKRIYGENYMEPVQDKGTTHGEVQFDTRNTYLNYIQRCCDKIGDYS